MARKIMALTLALILVLSLALSATAFACNSQGNGKANSRELKQLEKLVKEANKQIEKLVKIAQKTAWDDVDWLLFNVNCISAGVKSYGRLIGVTVVCDYVTYYIDGRYVEVDPLRVVRG